MEGLEPAHDLIPCFSMPYPFTPNAVPTLSLTSRCPTLVSHPLIQSTPPVTQANAHATYICISPPPTPPAPEIQDLQRHELPEGGGEGGRADRPDAVITAGPGPEKGSITELERQAS